VGDYCCGVACRVGQLVGNALGRFSGAAGGLGRRSGLLDSLLGRECQDVLPRTVYAVGWKAV
jgi:hypothetical protein